MTPLQEGRRIAQDCWLKKKSRKKKGPLKKKPRGIECNKVWNLTRECSNNNKKSVVDKTETAMVTTMSWVLFRKKRCRLSNPTMDTACTSHIVKGWSFCGVYF